MSSKPQLVVYLPWKDFRLIDNPALYEALRFSREKKIPFLPIFILDKGWAETDVYNLGYPRRFALSQVLSKFAKIFKRFEVIIAEPEDLIEQLTTQVELYVFINDDVEPFVIRRHQKLEKILQKQGDRQYFFRLKNELSVPFDVRSGSGNLYSIFTPFKNAVWEDFLNSQVRPKADPESVEYFDKKLPVKFESVPVKQTELWKKLDQTWILKYGDGQKFNLDEIWPRPKLDQWLFTETDALKNFDEFNQRKIQNYRQNRDNLGLDAQIRTSNLPLSRGSGSSQSSTSRMSMPLAWGLVSARTLKNRILEEHQNPEASGIQMFIFELIWREFYRYILIHHQWVLDKEYQKKFQTGLDWVQGQEAERRFDKWIRGQTGYKLVDAAMNQIASESWMHNRSRMVVASILTKNFGVDWRWGQDYFRAMLIDLDESSNNGGWQWSASVGADPKPIRIFNPYLQAEKYDPENKYQQKWLPSGYDYAPIVEHQSARKQAQERYARAKWLNRPKHVSLYEFNKTGP